MYRPLKRWWARETRQTPDGYVIVKVPEHPKSFRGGWYYEHRLVMEAILDRILETWEQVHHINEIKSDNHHLNLFVCSAGEHRKAHRRA